MPVRKRLAPPTSTRTLPTPNHQNSQNSTSNHPNQTILTNESSSPCTNQRHECGLKLKNQKGLKTHQSSKYQRNKTYQPPLDSGLATLTPDARPVNQGCSIPPSPVQIMAISTLSAHYLPMTCESKMFAVSSIAKNVINSTQAKHNSNSIRG